MTVIFIFPLVMSILAALVVAGGDHGWVTKLTVCLMVVTSLVLQFLVPLPDVPRLLVPLFLQLIICGWWYYASQYD
jgi:hypothetical protein